MAKKALIELGGENNYIQLISIVNRVHDLWNSENVNVNTIRCQVRMRCVNGHPGHDDFPDKGMLWRTQPTFVSNNAGAYRIFSPEKDREIYNKALAEHGETIESSTNLPLINEYTLQQSSSTYLGQIKDVLSILEECGQKMGFESKREWLVPFGRIDLVWFVRLPIIIPQLESNDIPIVGFELETGWRTRKHIKGDLFNLQSLQASIGIIVQQIGNEGNTNDVEQLIQNTRQLINQMGKSLFIWTDSDIQKLASSLGVLNK